MSESIIASTAAPRRRIFVWDLPVRLVHWSLVVLLGVLYVTARVLDDGMELHALAGYAVLTLVLFRLLWGLVGGTHARFRDFVRAPGAVWRHLRGLFGGERRFIAGHNPLGGWMVVLLLLALLGQAGLGLFSTDDILFDGPLSSWVGRDMSTTLTGLHAQLFDVLLVLVGVHVAAVVFHRLYKGENLVPAMFTGYKTLPPQADGRDAAPGNPLLAALLLATCAGLVYVLVS